MANNDYRLKWQKDFDSWFDVYSTYIVEGLVDDLQPYKESEDATIEYLPLYDYLARVYGASNENPERRKLVITYDPTESEILKFKIYDDVGMPVIEEPENNGDSANTEENQEAQNPSDITIDTDVRLQYGKKLSQRFYDILHNENISNLLIGHDSEGPSLDIAKIHYAISYDSERSDSFVDTIKDKLVSIFNIGEEYSDEENGYLFIFKMGSRLLSRDGDASGLSPDELMVFRELLSLSQAIENDEKLKGKHKLVILCNATKDLPKWFVDEMNNPYIKVITVSKPSEENRINFFNEVIKNQNGELCLTPEFNSRFDELEEEARRNGKTNSFYTKFLAYTNDFSTKQLLHYAEFLKTKPLEDPAKIGFSISTFQVGDMTNPWDDEEKVQKLLSIKETVSKKIQGQDYALDQVQAILKRAALGIDRDENPNAPRAILFLAGPTGTGKTEICKQIAETIFGSEDRMVRFDMSEYGEKESDQKLFGAPPGYIGYEEGGKLTNAIKKEPFSLVLFDEIEKAHNSILDKFLQILGDGRLTDGKGETVRFTDTIIAITSNAGVLQFSDRELGPEGIKRLMNDEEPPAVQVSIKTIIDRENEILAEKGSISEEDEKEIYEQLKEHLRYNVKAYFHCQLKRPELYGRVEDSIVYYNYIGRNSVSKIVNSKIKSVCKTAENNFAMHIEVPDSVKAAIAEFCQCEHVRGIGARGIIKTTGKLFSTALSAFLGDYVSRPGGRAELNGKTLVASSDETIVDPTSIHFSIQ